MSGASQESEYHHVEAREWNDSREPTPEAGDAGGEPVLDPEDLGTFVVSATNAKRYRVVLVTEQAGVNAQSLERDPAPAGDEQARNRSQGGGFSGAVSTDQGDDLALVDVKRDPFQGMDVAVIGVDVVNV